jgi:hypothetical protein
MGRFAKEKRWRLARCENICQSYTRSIKTAIVSCCTYVGSIAKTGSALPTSERGRSGKRASGCGDLRRTHAIEQAAIAADATLCEYILRHATEGARYEDMCPPCGRVQFYRARRAFYWELDQRL